VKRLDVKRLDVKGDVKREDGEVFAPAVASSAVNGVV
jgi:hypothetical protein